jgi:hypothetical protein
MYSRAMNVFASLSSISKTVAIFGWLSAAQAREIFAGRITDWAQVGGTAGEIQVVSREKDSDAAKLRRCPAGRIPTSNALVAPGWRPCAGPWGESTSAIARPELNRAVKRLTVDAGYALIVAWHSRPTGAAHVLPGRRARPGRKWWRRSTKQLNDE